MLEIFTPNPPIPTPRIHSILLIRHQDIGLAVGGAVQFRKIFVDVRYASGLLNVDDEPTDDDLVLIENRALTFMVGFTIR